MKNVFLQVLDEGALQKEWKENTRSYKRKAKLWQHIKASKNTNTVSSLQDVLQD